MTLPRVLSWRSLRIAMRSSVALVGLVVIGLALWGLPAPPALTVEQGPRVSWKPALYRFDMSEFTARCLVR